MTNVLNNALALLRLVADSDAPLGVIELSRLAKLDKSTTSRLLISLSSHQFVHRGADRKYRVGAGLLSLSANFLGRQDVRHLAYPHLQRMRDATRETATLHLLVGDARVCIEGVESTEPVRRGVPLGEVQRLSEGPTGKAILAFLPAPRQQQVLQASGLSEHHLKGLCEQLAGIRDRGHIAVSDDSIFGVSGLSGPVFDSNGVVASITIAGPKQRWTPRRMDSYEQEFCLELRLLSDAFSGRQDRDITTGRVRLRSEGFS